MSDGLQASTRKEEQSLRRVPKKRKKRYRRGEVKERAVKAMKKAAQDFSPPSRRKLALQAIQALRKGLLPNTTCTHGQDRPRLGPAIDEDVAPDSRGKPGCQNIFTSARPPGRPSCPRRETQAKPKKRGTPNTQDDRMTWLGHSTRMIPAS